MAATAACLAGCDFPWNPPAGVGWSKQPPVDTRKARIDAKTALYQAVDDDQPLIRMHAVEALGQTLGAKAGNAILQALDDANPMVRFAAAMVAGDLAYEPAREALARMAGDKRVEPDRRVLCAVLYALNRLGDDRYTTELGRLLFDKEPEVRSQAALAMGKMGEPSAVGPLKTLLSDEIDRKVQWNVRESLAMLGDSASAVSLEGYARQRDVQLRLAAVEALGRIPGESAVAVLRGLASAGHPARVRVAAAGSLGRLGVTEDAAYALCAAAASDPGKVLRDGRAPGEPVKDDEVRSLRRLAAISLGWMRRGEAVRILRNVLAGPDATARVAAAMSLLRLTEPAPSSAAKTPASPAPFPASGARALPPPMRIHSAGGKD